MTTEEIKAAPFTDGWRYAEFVDDEQFAIIMDEEWIDHDIAKIAALNDL